MLATAIDQGAVSQSLHDATTLDLLIRIQLSDDGLVRAVDLCDQLQKSPSHVSRVIDGAEAEGLVRRTPDPRDRRAHLVVLTEDGSAVVQEFVPHLVDVLQQTVFSALTDSEIETLVDLLDRVALATSDLLAEWIADR